jgi:RNA polymerase sigma factor (sigma-70 family)
MNLQTPGTRQCQKIFVLPLVALVASEKLEKECRILDEAGMYQWMHSLEDIELLHEYAQQNSEDAFEKLVVRHVNLVYSAALRQVREPILAGEVTQTVFIILGRKAHALSNRTILPAWLYRTTRLVAGRALRSEFRRRKREQEAAQMEPEHSEAAWQQIAPLLDEAMECLGDTDRSAIILRFFQKKNLREVGAALGTNESAAQKRVARAIHKLRSFLHQRGVVVPVVVLGAALSGNAVQSAPAGVATLATAGLKPVTASSSTMNLLNGTLKLMAWTKLKIGAIAGAVVLLGIGGTGYLGLAVTRSFQAVRSNSPVIVPVGVSNSVSVLLGSFHTNGDAAVTVDVTLRNHTAEPLEFGYGVQIKVPEGWAHTNGNVYQALTISPSDDTLRPLSDRTISVQVPASAALWRVFVPIHTFENGQLALDKKAQIFYSPEVAGK